MHGNAKLKFNCFGIGIVQGLATRVSCFVFFFLPPVLWKWKMAVVSIAGDRHIHCWLSLFTFYLPDRAGQLTVQAGNCTAGVRLA